MQNDVLFVNTVPQRIKQGVFKSAAIFYLSHKRDTYECAVNKLDVALMESLNETFQSLPPNSGMTSLPIL